MYHEIQFSIIFCKIDLSSYIGFDKWRNADFGGIYNNLFVVNIKGSIEQSDIEIFYIDEGVFCCEISFKIDIVIGKKYLQGNFCIQNPFFVFDWNVDVVMIEYLFDGIVKS